MAKWRYLVDVDTVVELIYPLLDAYDIGLWEDIAYVDLADEYVSIVQSDEYSKVIKSDNEDCDEYIKQQLKKFILSKSKEEVKTNERKSC